MNIPPILQLDNEIKEQNFLFNVFKSLKWQTLAAGVDDEDKWIC
jgi:hypothetical protein